MLPHPSTVCGLFVAVTLTAACADHAPSVGRAVQPVIYGTDDRQDVYAHPDMNLRALAQGSIVALMRDTALDLTDPMNVAFTGTNTLSTSQNLCPGQRFENDPAHSDCSGTLIDDDLVLTAGHCFTAPDTDAGASGPSTCQNVRFVFKYYHEAAGRLATITRNDVFSCAEIITRVERTNPDGTLQDYAFVRLDRSAAPRFSPVRVARSNAPTAAGQSITVIGFGSGIPAKIDSGGTVTDIRASAGDFFEVNSDTFSGNSGSGVFDTTTREMLGILVRGATDYVPTMGGSCNVANICASVPSGTDCGGESVNRLSVPFEDFCTRRPMHRLCGGMADAGITPADAGNPPADAGNTPADAGVIPADVAAPADDGTTPEAEVGGGGCSASMPSRRGPWSMILVAAAMSFAMRRRHARR